jgi:hypothetical protein
MNPSTRLFLEHHTPLAAIAGNIEFSDWAGAVPSKHFERFVILVFVQNQSNFEAQVRLVAATSEAGPPGSLVLGSLDLAQTDEWGFYVLEVDMAALAGSDAVLLSMVLNVVSGSADLSATLLGAGPKYPSTSELGVSDGLSHVVGQSRFVAA